MGIIDTIKSDKVTLSFEIFPPKETTGFDKVLKAAKEIAMMKPSFISVTYRLGGSSYFTAELAQQLRDKTGVPVLAHLTCANSTHETVKRELQEYRERGLTDIFALRGDVPEGGSRFHDYKYASELVAEIKAAGDEFHVGGACYPEGHVECEHKADDINHLKIKVDAGCEFLTTQMFFDNNIYYNFLYRLRDKGIGVPIVPGIMPVTTAKMLSRSVAMSGTNVPEKFRAIVDHFGPDPEAMQQAGIIYASEQIIDLVANGVKHVHVYTMNKPHVAEAIMKNLEHIIEI